MHGRWLLYDTTGYCRELCGSDCVYTWGVPGASKTASVYMGDSEHLSVAFNMVSADHIIFNRNMDHNYEQLQVNLESLFCNRL